MGKTGKSQKWYNKIFIGNPDKADFSAKDLPKTRPDQYIDVIKLHFMDLIRGNLMYVLFLLPLLFWCIWFWFTASTAGADGVDLGSTVSMLLSFLLIAVPLYTLAGPAKAGLYYLLRNWTWNERATVSEHFWKEFKRSAWKAMLLNFINIGAVYAGLFWSQLLLEGMDKHPWFRWLSILVTVVVVLYEMTTIYQFPQLVTYDLRVLQIVKNSVIYTAAQLPRTLLAVLVVAVVVLLAYFFAAWIAILLLCIGLSFLFLAQTVYCQFLFDKYVNPPEARRRGMAPEDAVR